EERALLLERVDPARHVARLAETLDGGVVEVDARVGVTGAHQLAGRAEILGGALVVARLLEEDRGLLELAERLPQLGRLVAIARRLVVPRRGLLAPLLEVEAREQAIRERGLAVALERTRRRGHVAIQVRRDRGRAAREEQALARREVDRELARLEGLHV